MSHTISPQGFAKLREEWEDLKYTQRPAMQRQVQDAAAEGDRSENAAYTYGKMRLREIDRRLRVLDKLIDSAEVREVVVPEDGAIRFGATIAVLDKVGKPRTYQLVGTAEVNPLEGRISMESPVGKALLGRKTGDAITVETPRGMQEFRIQEVRYG